MTMIAIPLLLAARLDWGLGNPNKTAALIAVLMVGVWALAWMRSWGFWASLAACAGLGVCLLQTASRGGLLAAMSGLAYMLIYAPKPWPKLKIFLTVGALMGLALFALKQATSVRYVQGIDGEDHSITNRLLIWKQVPRMILDAPSGWGFGNSGHAYMEWYQLIDHRENYRTLVSSHLTWLVEGNWLIRVGYVLGWCVVFVLCWPDTRNRMFSLALGIWAAFWLAALFSSVEECPWLWIVPLCSLTSVLVTRYKRQKWPAKWAWIGSTTSMFIVLGLLSAWGLKSAAQLQPIHSTAKCVQLGTGTPAFWIIEPKMEIVGSLYGHELRRENLVAAVIEHYADLPIRAPGAVVLTGELPPSVIIGSWKQIILLNPPAPPNDENFFGKHKECQIGIIWGDFRDGMALAAWQQLARDNHNIQVLQEPGAALYLPGWGRLIKQTKIEMDRTYDKAVGVNRHLKTILFSTECINMEYFL